jgi:hypothetical protein
LNSVFHISASVGCTLHKANQQHGHPHTQLARHQPLTTTIRVELIFTWGILREGHAEENMWAPLYPIGKPKPFTEVAEVPPATHTRRAEVKTSYYPSRAVLPRSVAVVWGRQESDGTWTLRWPAKLLVAGGRWGEPFPKCRRPRSPRTLVPRCAESGYCVDHHPHFFSLTHAFTCAPRHNNTTLGDTPVFPPRQPFLFFDYLFFFFLFRTL